MIAAADKSEGFNSSTNTTTNAMASVKAFALQNKDGGDAVWNMAIKPVDKARRFLGDMREEN
jgi:hypothetical protein